MNTRIAGIDLAKTTFQLCVLDKAKVLYNRPVKRALLLDLIRQLPPDTLIAMEACATAHCPLCFARYCAAA